ncbi:hypothetical protein FACS1894130_12050 [Spirochaetia bacterium]|nr:hypothetical protein FACS1894130_12050 [Spirochaetia bacterium]
MMEWDKYFEMIKNWKKLPAYSLERRIDSLLGYYLPSFLEDKCNTGEITAIIPEFPIRIRTIRSEHADNNEACRFDFMAVNNTGDCYLIEVKTDEKSIRDIQMQDLERIKKSLPSDIFEGIIKVLDNKNSSKRKKNRCLKEILMALNLIDEKKYTGNGKKIEVIAILPDEKRAGKIDFKKIGFEQLADWFREKNDVGEFEKSFSNALKSWTND